MKVSHSGKYHLNLAIYLLLLFLLFTAIRTKAQELKTQPKESYKIQKEVYENGNIICHDSTYSYFYSGTGEDIDSLFRSFNRNFPFDFDSVFSFDFNDSFFNHPFPGFDHDFDFYFDGANFRNLDEFLIEHDLLFEKYFGRRKMEKGKIKLHRHNILKFA